MANHLDFGPNFMDTINIYEKVKFKNLKKFSDSNIFYNADKKFTNSNKILKSVEK